MIDRGPASRPYVLDRPSPGVSRVRFSDPASRNALDLALVQHLRDDLSSITEGVVVIASTYAEAFSSGVDVKMSNSKRAEVSRALYELYETILLSPCPVLAVVEGPAVGGGAQIALASDLRIAGPGARFRFPGIHHGIPIGMWALPAIVGRGRALDLCLTARWVDAPEAHRIGLVDRLDDLPMEVALRVARDIAQAPSGAAARIKSSANAADILARLRAEAATSENWSGALGDQA